MSASQRTTCSNRRTGSLHETSFDLLRHCLSDRIPIRTINLVTMFSGSKLVYGYESADPVEELHFLVNGISMTDFVYPTYFEAFHKPGSVQFDHLDTINEPFQIHVGGYQGVYKNGKWTQIFGSAAKKKRFAREDRRGRRSEQRTAKKRVRSS